MGILNGNGEIKSNLAAVFLIAGSSYVLYWDMIPWWAALGGITMGLYLFLPQRMRKLSDWTADVGNKLIAIWKKKNE